MTAHVAAVDLGATSGRVMMATFRKDGVAMELVSRFPNIPTEINGAMRWDLTGLFTSVTKGLTSLLASGRRISSIGIDSWAVDYGLMRSGELVAEPRHYRDARTAAGVEAVHAVLSHHELYARNGLQFLPFNTIYQLAADNLDGALDDVDSLLLIPDLIAYWLTGENVCEETNASTTGLLPAGGLKWDEDLINRLSLRESLFPGLIRSGDRIGDVIPRSGMDIDSLDPLPVIAVGSHDTASAVVAVPMDPSTAVYISCGTWGLVGVELDDPILTAEAEAANFTNERGVDGTTRFLTNVMGLWLLSQCVADWEQDGPQVDLKQLLGAAAQLDTPPLLLDVRDPEFLAPGRMNQRIAAHLAQRGSSPPSSRPETARLVVESLAAAFASSAHTAADLAGIDLDRIHIVGGGVLNTLLCQLVADYSANPVVAGPVEATALGNVLVQARSLGLVGKSLAALRNVVRSSSQLTQYQPHSQKCKGP